ncbi:MAG TPA: MFS transporter [Burkholderiales bacterium]|nr:MFS transporter [Burkholderiales bacterium]
MRPSTVPRTVWVLGTVSLCMDLSSELVHSLLPLFLTGVLGAGMVAVGVIEGVAEATASIVKVVSGALSDRLPRRKPVVVAGYALAALSKPLFPLAASVPLVLFARFVDRIGKGIRGAPRDALIADLTPPGSRGAAYGLRQALDTIGAVLGPLSAAGLMLLLADDIRSVLWIAVLPALAAVAVLFFWVREPERESPPAPARGAARFAGLERLGARFWLVVALGAVLMLARFSEAFLLLRAQEIGVALAAVPLVMVGMNIVYTAVAYPAGLAADRGHRRALLVVGLAALIAADLVIGAFGSIAGLGAGIVLWGVHMGLTQGLLSTLVADAAPADLRGTAFGVFNLVSGIALLAASVLAGWLWSAYGASATFYAGAGFCAVALAGLLIALKK